VAILETLRATGCRVGELVGLRTDDLEYGLDAKGNEVGSGLVHGKGDKYRKVYWDPWAWKALKAYHRARGAKKGQPAFCGHGNRNDGNALTTRHVARTIQRLALTAGVRNAEQVTPHYFRHVFATRALERTDNLALVQDMLGHASPVTTRVYAKTDDAQRQAAHAQVWA
jgi:site-specific recombinase XerD